MKRIVINAIANCHDDVITGHKDMRKSKVKNSLDSFILKRAKNAHQFDTTEFIE